jgi:hypothetical protein
MDIQATWLYFLHEESLLMKKYGLPSAVAAVGVCIVLSSCAAFYHYNFSLLAVSRPKAAAEKYGQVCIQSVDSVVSKYRAQDSLVDIVFSLNAEQIEFICTNKTARSIKIDWEKAVYINPYGARKRVIHAGIPYERKSDPQLPSIIRKGETMKDHVLPSDNVNVYLYGSGGFTIYPLFSGREFGKSASLLLPLEIDGVENDYVFRFAISSVQ